MNIRRPHFNFSATTLRTIARSCIFLASLCSLGIADVAFAAERTDTADAAALVQSLRAHAMPIRLQDGRLQGPGAEWISRESADAQFVLIGEDHGMAEAPGIATALWNAGGFRQLVIEAGPYATAAMNDALQKDPDGLAAINARFPTSIPFFNWREDGAMAAAAVASRHRDALCGVDQEFILSGRPLFRALAELAPDAAAKRLALGYATRDDAMYVAMTTQRDADSNLLTKLEAKDFDALRKAFRTRRAAIALIDDLATSADIYQLQSTDPGRSNAMRSTLMKRNFMRCLRREGDSAAAPRMLFRMGAFHVGRGRSPLGLFDLGNLASELAQSNGMRSLHLLVIASGGHVNRWFPFAPEDASKRADYDAKSELGMIGAGALIDAADARGWTLIPFAPLRTDAALRKAGGEKFDQLVFAYDAVVVVPDAQAATLY